jgi:hypothetical protein
MDRVDGAISAPTVLSRTAAWPRESPPFLTSPRFAGTVCHVP